MAYTKRWVEVDFGECDACGSDQVKVLTDCQEEGYFFDGDAAICAECGQKGQFCGDPETPGFISWHDEQ